MLPAQLLLCLTLATTACITRTPFNCANSGQCDVGGASGTCEASGFCSLPDSSCDSGRRYASDAPSELAGECVDQSGPKPDGGPDAAIDADVYVDFTPSNFEATLLTAGEGALIVRASDGPVEIDGAQGTVVRTSDGADLRPAAATFTSVNQGSAPSIGVFSVSSISIEAGAQVRLKGSAAVAFAVATDVHIAGTIDLRGGGASPSVAGPGGFVGGKAGAPQGGGPCGGTAVDAMGDVGGGGGGHVATGGAGGMRGGIAGGVGGSLCGVAELVPLVGGSGGGAGGGGATRGPGGGGGGALQISARGEILLFATGGINAGGAGGGGGGNDDGGGGGGAGGAVLLEAKRIVIDGALVANGGGGGAGANTTIPGAPGQPGGAGSGRASGGARSGEGGAGGGGGAGGNATAGGDPGESVPGVASNDNAGGGGAAAGRLRLRADEILKTGVISPSAGLTEAPLQ
jgi:hypothetical protein